MTADLAIALAIILLTTTATLFGVTLSLSYLVIRMLRSDGWDKSNVTNALRVLSHVVLHPEDLGKLYYLTRDQVQQLELLSTYQDGKLKRPFWYIDKDELSEVVRSRPNDFV